MKPSIIVVYATWTGHTEEIANRLVDAFHQSNLSADLFECQQVNASKLLEYDICVVATYTFGSAGELPDEMYPFYDEMETVDLSGKIYGVLGSGDLYYDWFCKAVDDFDVRFSERKAIKGVENLKIDMNNPEEGHQKISDFSKELVQAFEKLISPTE